MAKVLVTGGARSGAGRSPWLLPGLVAVLVLASGCYAAFGGRLLLAVVGLAALAVVVAGGSAWSLLAAAGVSSFLSVEPAPVDILAILIALAAAAEVVRGRWKEWRRGEWTFLGLLAALAVLSGGLFLLHPGRHAAGYVVISVYLMALAAAVVLSPVSSVALETFQRLLVGVTLAATALVAMALPGAWAAGRLKAFTKDPNVLGALLAMVLVIVAAELIARRPRGRRLLVWGAAAVVGHILLLLTASRGAILGLLFAYAVLLLVRRPRVISIIALAVGAVGAVYFIWSALGPGRAEVAQQPVAPLAARSFESNLEGFRPNDAELSLVNMGADGKRSLRVEGFSGSGRAEGNLPTEVARPLQDQTLSLSVSVRREQGAGPVTIGIIDNLGPTYQTVAADDREWRRVQVSRSVKSGASWITVVLYGGEVGKEQGISYFDALQLDWGAPRDWAGVSAASEPPVTEGAPIRFNVIESFAGAVLPINAIEAVTQAVSPGKFGEQALQVRGESVTGRVQGRLTDAEVAAARGRSITLSAYVHKLVGEGPTTLSIADDEGVTYANPLVGTDWQRVQVTRKIAPNATRIELALYGGQLEVAPGTAVWDGFQIEMGPVATDWLGQVPVFREPPPPPPPAPPAPPAEPTAAQGSALSGRSLLARDGLSFVIRRFTESDPGRLAAWHLGSQLIQRFPLGIGPGSFETYSASVATVREAGIAPHNTYLRVLVELGYGGLLLYLLLIAFSFRQAVRLASQPASAASAIMIALPAIQAGMFVQGIVIDSLHWRHWWLLIALPFAVGRITAVNPQKAVSAAKDGIVQ